VSKYVPISIISFRAPSKEPSRLDIFKGVSPVDKGRAGKYKAKDMKTVGSQ
jgi:hypothetical protein